MFYNNFSTKIVAKPKKNKNPSTSVNVVTNIDDALGYAGTANSDWKGSTTKKSQFAIVKQLDLVFRVGSAILPLF